MSDVTWFLIDIMKKSKANHSGFKLHLNADVYYQLSKEYSVLYERVENGPAKKSLIGMEIVIDHDVVYAEVIGHSATPQT